MANLGVESWNFAEEFMATFRHAPVYHLVVEGLLIISVIVLLFSKSYKLKKEIQLTNEEKEELIADWQPEPLVPVNSPEHIYKVVSKQGGSDLTVNGKSCLNLATFNFLGLLGNRKVEESAINSLHKYGVGACGPRAFFGTFGHSLTYISLQYLSREYRRSSARSKDNNDNATLTLIIRKFKML